MSGINLVHSSTKTGKERWDWSVWLEGAPAELDLVDRVVYRLHPTFPNPERVVSDRATQFLLQSSGWGEFMIYADVKRKGLPPLELRHWLTLEGATLPADESTGKSVFLSTSAADEPVADALHIAFDANVHGDDFVSHVTLSTETTPPPLQAWRECRRLSRGRRTAPRRSRPRLSW